MGEQVTRYSSWSDLAEALHRAVTMELQRRGLFDAEALARGLGLAPIKTVELLRRSQWPLETSIAVIEAFDLPISVAVHREGGKEAVPA